MARGCINRDFGDGQREVVFWACLVEVSEVDTNSKLSILLTDGDYVCNPCWVCNFSNESRINQLIYLFFNLRDEFGTKPALSLLHWP